MNADFESELRRSRDDDRWNIDPSPDSLAHLRVSRAKRRRVRVAAAGGATGAALAAIIVPMAVFARPASPGSSSVVEQPAASASPSASAPPSEPPSPSASPTATYTPFNTCNPSDLRATELATDNGGGTASVELELTNTGSASCQMLGYPNVSIQESGAAVTLDISPEAPSDGTLPQGVTLATGQSAIFYVGIGEMMVTCSPRQGTLEILPPGVNSGSGPTLQGWGLCPGQPVSITSLTPGP